MDLNKALGAAGAGQQVTAKGRVWTLLPPTKGCVAAFQAWLEGEALKKLAEQKKTFTTTTVDARGRTVEVVADAYEDLENKTLGWVYTGKFAWHEPLSKAAQRTPAGVLKLITILIQQAHPDLTDEGAAELFANNPDGFVLALKVLQKGSPPKESPAAEVPP